MTVTEDHFVTHGFDIPMRLLNLTGGGASTFERSSHSHMEVLRKHVGLRPSHAVLEIGCGIGRDAIPLLNILGPSGSYVGIDIIKDSIDWCQDNITRRNPRFSFYHFNVKDQLHNPGGETRTTDIHLPVASGTIDRIILWSVFTHMFEQDIVHYLREFRRVLKPDGMVYATWFIVDDRVFESVKSSPASNTLRFEQIAAPGCHINDPVHPLGAVAFQEQKLNEMIRASGLKLAGEILRGAWSGHWPNPHEGQDATLLAVDPTARAPSFNPLIKMLRRFTGNTAGGPAR